MQESKLLVTENTLLICETCEEITSHKPCGYKNYNLRWECINCKNQIWD